MRISNILVPSILILTGGVAQSRSQEPYIPIWAQSYANQWVENGRELRNPKYKYFTNDCTNFVSQSLAAGGWRNTSIGPDMSDLYWYYVPSTHQSSQTWRVANSLYRRFVQGYEGWYGGKVLVPSTLRARVGDIIFANWNSDTTIDHAMMVTGIASNGEPLVSYHSTDRENLPWSRLLTMSAPAGVPQYAPTFYKYSQYSF